MSRPASAPRATRRRRSRPPPPVDQLVRDVRIAGYDPTGAGIAALTLAGADRLELQADLDGNGAIDASSEERIGYRVAPSSRSLQRIVGSQSLPILSDVAADGLRLSYFDAAGAALDPTAAAHPRRDPPRRDRRHELAARPDRERPRARRRPAGEPMTAKGSALVVAILLIALAGVLTTTLTDLGRLALRRARLDRDGVRAWFVAEAGLAETAATLPAGHAFTDALRAAPAPPAPAGAPWTYALGFLDDGDEHPNDATTDVNARVILRVNAFGPGARPAPSRGRPRPPCRPAPARGPHVGRRRPDPDCRFSAGWPRLRHEQRLHDRGSGRIPAPACRSRTEPGCPCSRAPSRSSAAATSPSIERHAAPVLRRGRERRGTRAIWRPGSLAPSLGTVASPRFVVVDGDAVADAATSGAGALFVAGRLRVSGRLAFTGSLAAAGGIEVAPGASLEVCGGVFAAGPSAFDARGTGFVRASSTALRMAATLAPLPARARVLAVREAS